MRAATWSAYSTALHAVGDSVGATGHIRRALAADGTLTVVEPNAGDALEDNLDPIGRTYYGLSTVIYTQGSLLPGGWSWSGRPGR